MRCLTTFSILLLSCAALLSQPNTWIPIADFPGGGRAYSVSFSINNQGYVGLSGNVNDLWKYDPATNIWSQCSNFPAPSRFAASAFVIGAFAYVGNGRDSTGDRNDFWKYDAAANQWAPIASCPGAPRIGAVSFAIGNRGYVGGGRAWLSTFYSDMWQYLTSSDTWSSIAPLPSPRCGCACFVIGNCGYVAGGADTSGTLNEAWKYNVSLNAWLPCANVIWPSSGDGFGFTINGKGYFGCGWDGNVLTNGVRLYDPITDSWSWAVGYPGGYVSGAAAFVCNDTAYVGLGDWSWADSSFWKFYPSPDVGVNEQGVQNSASVYPNPAINDVTITVNETPADQTLTIRTFDEQGRLLRNETMTPAVTSLLYQRNGLPAGTYLIEVWSEGKITGRCRIVFQ